jgi:hypothetical protein
MSYKRPCIIFLQIFVYCLSDCLAITNSKITNYSLYCTSGFNILNSNVAFKFLKIVHHKVTIVSSVYLNKALIK